MCMIIKFPSTRINALREHRGTRLEPIHKQTEPADIISIREQIEFEYDEQEDIPFR